MMHTRGDGMGNIGQESVSHEASVMPAKACHQAKKRLRKVIEYLFKFHAVKKYVARETCNWRIISVKISVWWATKGMDVAEKRDLPSELAQLYK